jgi:hypothetical protein
VPRAGSNDDDKTERHASPPPLSDDGAESGEDGDVVPGGGCAGAAAALGRGKHAPPPRQAALGAWHRTLDGALLAALSPARGRLELRLLRRQKSASWSRLGRHPARRKSCCVTSCPPLRWRASCGVDIAIRALHLRIDIALDAIHVRTLQSRRRACTRGTSSASARARSTW